MEARAKRLFIVAIFLLIGAFATCYFGVHHEIEEIPEQQRAAMTDFDWIGVPWIERGIAIAGVALIVGSIAGVLQWRDAR
jgi:hypothetical protein